MSNNNAKSNEDGEVYPLPIEDAENEDIVFVEKGISTDFECLVDSITLVIKNPSIPSDKFVI